MLASLRSAKKSLVSAARIRPRVIPAADPTKLDNHPANRNEVAADLHYHAGRVFESQNSFETAGAHYRDALARNPDNTRLLTSYARVQDRLGNVAEADALYARAIQLNPNDASCHNDWAMCHARHGKADQAVEHFQQAIGLAPSNKLYRNNLAQVLVGAGRRDEALRHLVAAHGEAIAHYNLGYMLLERNAPPLAAAHFRRALELNPQLVAARQMLSEVERTAPGLGLAPAKARALPVAAAAHHVPVGLARLPAVTPTSNLAVRFSDAVR